MAATPTNMKVKNKHTPFRVPCLLTEMSLVGGRAERPGTRVGVDPMLSRSPGYGEHGLSSCSEVSHTHHESHLVENRRRIRDKVPASAPSKASMQESPENRRVVDRQGHAPTYRCHSAKILCASSKCRICPNTLTEY